MKYKDYDNRYIHQFFNLSVAPKLLEIKLFPDAKEFTESMGAFKAVKNYIMNENINQKSKVKLVVVGDGTTPRTAGLFAVMTRWDCYSIDPALKENKVYAIDRLKTFKNKIEEVKINCDGDICVLVCVHSHAMLSECVKSINNCKELHIVNIPCCFESDLNIEPNHTFKDKGIYSEKNLIEIYKKVENENG